MVALLHSYTLYKNYFIISLLQIVGEIEAAIVEKLDSCETDACRVPYVRALANAGLPSTLPLMLRYAENASSAALAEQAVLAMRRLDRHLIDEQVRYNNEPHR